MCNRKGKCNRLIFFDELLPDLLLSLQNKKEQYSKQQAYTYHRKVFAPVARRLIPQIGDDGQDCNIDEQHRR